MFYAVAPYIVVGGVTATLAYIVAQLSQQTTLPSNAVTDALLQSSTDAVFIVDRHGKITGVNSQAELLADQTESILGKSFTDVLHFKDRSNHAIDLHRLQLTASIQVNTIDILYKNEADQEVKLQLKVNNLSEGKQNLGLIIRVLDLTFEKSLDQQRDEFISIISHELRTPIAAIEGSLSGMLADKKEPLTALQTQMLNIAYDKTQVLSDTVNNLSMVLQADRKTLDTAWQTVAPGRILEHLYQVFQAVAHQRNIEFKLSNNSTKSLLTDAQYLQEILTAFISNALEYTPNDGKGRVLLEAHENDSGIIFSVADNGPGMSPSDQQLLFKKYFRSEDYKYKTTKGTGLSLYIAQQLTNRLGGKIWCESKLTEGSTFYLFLPYAATVTEDQADAIRAEVTETLQSI